MYIAVEGPIGVGKTTLAELLAGKLNGKTLVEEVEANPFLPNFYRDRNKYAFQAQLFFLLSRYQQQKELAQTELFSATLIADYLRLPDP
jgi:deoxyadenosine/deoxycytidine kinase